MTAPLTLWNIRKILRFFRLGGSLRMVLEKDITESLEVLYHYAMQLAHGEEHAAAARIFKLLTLYDAWSFEYWYQLGQCCQAQQALGDAIYAYGRAACIRLDMPQAPWGAAECFLACGNYSQAKKALRAVVLICGDGAEHEDLRQRAVNVLRQIADRR